MSQALQTVRRINTTPQGHLEGQVEAKRRVVDANLLPMYANNADVSAK